MWRDFCLHTPMLAPTYCRKIHLRAYFIHGHAGINVKIWVWQLRSPDAQALYCCSLSCSCSSVKIVVNNIAVGVNPLFWVSQINRRYVGLFKVHFPVTGVCKRAYLHTQIHKSSKKWQNILQNCDPSGVWAYGLQLELVWSCSLSWTKHETQSCLYSVWITASWINPILPHSLNKNAKRHICPH